MPPLSSCHLLKLAWAWSGHPGSATSTRALGRYKSRHAQNPRCLMAFPVTRLRRLRRTSQLRDMVRETRLTPEAFVYPMFVCPGEGVRKAIGSMPGVFNLSVDEAVKEASTPKSLGAAVAERESAAKGSVVPKASGKRGIDSSASGSTSDYEIDNDASLELLARASVSLTRAGVDIIAPSDMMDGRVAAIRRALDDAGFINTPILSYAAKFASGFYGPFREAADSAPQFGDRRSYQMDGGNLREAMREIELDIEEGADMIMVKPAMPYLDVIAAARERFDLPLAAYQVSGEYAMIEAAARNGWIERERVMMESLLSIRRAGASIILTYYAKDAARLLA